MLNIALSVRTIGLLFFFLQSCKRSYCHSPLKTGTFWAEPEWAQMLITCVPGEHPQRCQEEDNSPALSPALLGTAREHQRSPIRLPLGKGTLLGRESSEALWEASVGCFPWPFSAKRLNSCGSRGQNFLDYTALQCSLLESGLLFLRDSKFWSTLLKV